MKQILKPKNARALFQPPLGLTALLGLACCLGWGCDDEGEDPLDVIDAGELGYCQFLKFKCAAERTCEAWVSGGPLDDDKKVS